MKHPTIKRYLMLAVLLPVLIFGTPLRSAQAIIGGEDAKSGEYPFIVALVLTDDGSQFCGGSIINAEWVLTAAHCFYSDDTPPVQDTFESDVQVKAGIIDLDDTSAQTANVKAIYNPGYDGEVHDIALLHLSKPLKLDNKTVAKVKLNTDPDVPSKTAQLMVAGWGAIDRKGEKYISTLKKVTLPVVTCDADTEPEYVCTASRNGKDICSGDSGSPLVTQRTDDTVAPDDLLPGIHALQVGIVSYGGDRCGQGSGYTRVASYIDWINKTIAAHSKS